MCDMCHPCCGFVSKRNALSVEILSPISPWNLQICEEANRNLAPTKGSAEKHPERRAMPRLFGVKSIR